MIGPTVTMVRALLAALPDDAYLLECGVRPDGEFALRFSPRGITWMGVDMGAEPSRTAFFGGGMQSCGQSFSFVGDLPAHPPELVLDRAAFLDDGKPEPTICTRNDRCTRGYAHDGVCHCVLDGTQPPAEPPTRCIRNWKCDRGYDHDDLCRPILTDAEAANPASRL